MTPHPLTIASIKLQHIEGGHPNIVYPCGCTLLDRSGSGDWKLCMYHEGYDEGMSMGPVEVKRHRIHDGHHGDVYLVRRTETWLVLMSDGSVRWEHVLVGESPAPAPSGE